MRFVLNINAAVENAPPGKPIPPRLSPPFMYSSGFRSFIYFDASGSAHRVSSSFNSGSLKVPLNVVALPLLRSSNMLGLSLSRKALNLSSNGFGFCLSKRTLALSADVCASRAALCACVDASWLFLNSRSCLASWSELILRFDTNTTKTMAAVTIANDSARCFRRSTRFSSQYFGNFATAMIAITTSIIHPISSMMKDMLLR